MNIPSVMPNLIPSRKTRVQFQSGKAGPGVVPAEGWLIGATLHGCARPLGTPVKAAGVTLGQG